MHGIGLVEGAYCGFYQDKEKNQVYILYCKNEASNIGFRETQNRWLHK